MGLLTLMIDVWITINLPLICFNLKSKLLPLSFEKSQVFERSCFSILKLLNCLSSSIGFILRSLIWSLDSILSMEKLLSLNKDWLT